MFGDEENKESFEEMLRSVARKLGESMEQAVGGFDPDQIADRFGVDPAVARDWMQSASSWVRAQAEGAADETARRVNKPKFTSTADDSLLSAAPHPLDLPTDEQGLALAALDSGRWSVEPVSSGITAHDGARPRDTRGIVRELRVHDWITYAGAVTLAGRHALERWLAASTIR
jgi:hypothetical protein